MNNSAGDSWNSGSPQGMNNMGGDSWNGNQGCGKGGDSWGW
jgi:hypothetical protein